MPQRVELLNGFDFRCASGDLEQEWEQLAPCRWVSFQGERPMENCLFDVIPEKPVVAWLLLDARIRWPQLYGLLDLRYRRAPGYPG